MGFETPVKVVEQQANSQENASLLLFARLSNQNIRKQIIDLLYESEIWEAANGFEFETSRNADGSVEKDKNGHVMYVEKPHIALSREHIERRYDRILQRIKTSTDIDFSSEQPTGGDESEPENISLNWKLPSGDKPTAHQLSIIEAHEKGHSIRPYHGEYFFNYFFAALDVPSLDFTDEDYNEVVKLFHANGTTQKGPTSLEEQKDEFYSYMSSGTEIVERMSQLKNYFGFRGDEQFTLEHLRYAKEHYVKDTGLDNRMTPFFKAITPETEEEFIRLINSSGV